MNAVSLPGAIAVTHTSAPTVGTSCLADCPKGVWVSVSQVEPNSVFGQQDEHVSQRMKELGFLPGTPLKIIGYGLFGSDPLAVQINGTKFALRRAEARKISVTPI